MTLNSGDRIRDAISRRIPLLDRTVDSLKQQIGEVESDFDKLAEIGKQFQPEIIAVPARQAKAIANSFSAYILDLEKQKPGFWPRRASAIIPKNCGNLIIDEAVFA
jgi:hypothetical protein